MNDAILQAMKNFVEQAVRPVAATMARKRQMREELLGHLMAIFDEEIAKLGDAQTALEQAKRRFGDPKELSGQLQQAVPWWNRCQAALENVGYRSDEAAWHLAVRHFFAMLLVYYPLMLAIMLAHEDIRHMRPPEGNGTIAIMLVGGVPVISLVNVLLSITLAPLVHKIGRGLSGKRFGRILLGEVCCVVAVCGLLAPAIAGAAILFILMARQAVQQRRYEADWI
jgi:hypothetical protein